MAWVGLTSGLNIFYMKDAICSAVSNLIAERLDILENWMTDHLILGRGNPKDLLIDSELIVHMIQDPLDDRT